MPTEVSQLVLWPLFNNSVNQKAFKTELQDDWNPKGETNLGQQVDLSHQTVK